MLPLLGMNIKEIVSKPPFLLYFLPERGSRFHELWTSRAEGLNSELRAKGYPIPGGFAVASVYGLAAPRLPNPNEDFALLFKPEPVWITFDQKRHGHLMGDKRALVKAMSEQVIEKLALFKP